jgi:hypothetical protein
MAAEAPNIDRRCPPDAKAGKVRLFCVEDLDGRTRASQLVRATITSLADDLGGADRLSTAEKQIVNRAALVGAMCEDVGVRWLAGEPVDAMQLTTLANAERRLLEVLGMKRRARDVTPTLCEYLRGSSSERAAGESDSP